MSTSSSVFRAADFVNGIGVNTHLPYTDGGYYRDDSWQSGYATMPRHTYRHERLRHHRH